MGTQFIHTKDQISAIDIATHGNWGFYVDPRMPVPAGTVAVMPMRGGPGGYFNANIRVPTDVLLIEVVMHLENGLKKDERVVGIGGLPAFTIISALLVGTELRLEVSFDLEL